MYKAAITALCLVLLATSTAYPECLKKITTTLTGVGYGEVFCVKTPNRNYCFGHGSSAYADGVVKIINSAKSLNLSATITYYDDPEEKIGWLCELDINSKKILHEGCQMNFCDGESVKSSDYAPLLHKAYSSKAPALEYDDCFRTGIADGAPLEYRMELMAALVDARKDGVDVANLEWMERAACLTGHYLDYSDFVDATHGKVDVEELYAPLQCQQKVRAKVTSVDVGVVWLDNGLQATILKTSKNHDDRRIFAALEYAKVNKLPVTMSFYVDKKAINTVTACDIAIIDKSIYNASAMTGFREPAAAIRSYYQKNK